VLARPPGAPGERVESFDVHDYQQWRTSELQRHLKTHFDLSSLRDKDVLDFGCGYGDMCFIVANLGVKSIAGTELDRDCIEEAERRGQEFQGPVRPVFHLSSSASEIGLPDSSIDVILCFDVLEHVMDYRPILNEWKRVLRPGGRVLIWWVPWLNPWAHHLATLIPIPWAHVFFPERVLINTCARIYDMPDFEPRHWDRDENGGKKPNKWRTLERIPDLNRLTMAGFERACGVAGLRVARRKIQGFGGSAAGRLTNMFTRVPVLREYFCGSVVYEIGN
jgi:SAM-dependent methyltransferase